MMIMILILMIIPMMLDMTGHLDCPTTFILMMLMIVIKFFINLLKTMFKLKSNLPINSDVNLFPDICNMVMKKGGVRGGFS